MKKYMYYLFFICIPLSLSGDIIKLHNTTDRDLFARVYYQKMGDKSVKSMSEQDEILPIWEIPAGETIEVERPER